MPKYVIERDIPNAGKLSEAELQRLSQKSRAVIDSIGPSLQWVHSYVTEDKLYCIYIAPDKELILEHARRGGFPANRISEVKNMINPMTAQSMTRDETENEGSQESVNGTTVEPEKNRVLPSTPAVAERTRRY